MINAKIFTSLKILVWGLHAFYKDGTFYLFHQRDTRNPKPLTDPFGWSLVTTTDFVKFEEYGK